MKEIVAKIDWQENIRENFYDIDLSQFTKPYCDHCHANHNLRYTYIIRLEDGSLIQVGTECTDKVLGYEIDHRNYESVGSFDNFFRWGFRDNKFFKPRRMLYILSLYIEKYGKEKCLKGMSFSDLNDKEFIKELKANRQEEDYTLVDKVIKFYQELDTENDFKNNVRNLVITDYAEVRYFNIFKYAFKIYYDVVNYKPAYNSVITKYTETKVEKFEFCERQERNFGSYWHPTETVLNVYRIIDTNGNVFHVSTTKELELKKGDMINFKYSQMPFYQSKKYGIVNNIRNVKIVKGE